METKQFHLGDLIAIGTGCLVRDMDGIYKILNWVTQDNLMTHPLPRAMNKCKPWLLKQFPFLDKIDTDGINPENVT